MWQHLHPLKILVNVNQCFSTGVPQNLMVPSLASKGSAESNQETGTKRHLHFAATTHVFWALGLNASKMHGGYALPRRVPRTIKIAAKGSASKKRLKKTVL